MKAEAGNRGEKSALASDAYIVGQRPTQVADLAEMVVKSVA
jgi:hypothetical protein